MVAPLRVIKPGELSTLFPLILMLAFPDFTLPSVYAACVNAVEVKMEKPIFLLSIQSPCTKISAPLVNELPMFVL